MWIIPPTTPPGTPPLRLPEPLRCDSTTDGTEAQARHGPGQVRSENGRRGAGGDRETESKGVKRPWPMMEVDEE